MKPAGLVALNPVFNKKSELKANQELVVINKSPLLHVIVKREIIKKENIPFTKQVITNSSMFKGKTKVRQEGQYGNLKVHSVVESENGKVIDEANVSQKLMKQPVIEVIEKGTKSLPAQGTGSFEWPAIGGYISSKMGYRWGKLHKGIDIARSNDRVIKGADSGVVEFAGWSNGYGNKIIIDHKNGFKTLYGHLSSISINEGQIISKGSKIGIMGSTGDSTGVHLHFEVYKNGSLLNPLKYIHQ